MKTQSEPMRNVQEDWGLDSLFADARAAEPRVSEGLMARVLADADAMMPKALGLPEPQHRPEPRRGWLAGLWTVLGGPRGMAGLVAAGAAGVIIGFLDPVETAMASVWSAEETWELYPADIESYAYLLYTEQEQRD